MDALESAVIASPTRPTSHEGSLPEKLSALIKSNGAPEEEVDAFNQRISKSKWEPIHTTHQAYQEGLVDERQYHALLAEIMRLPLRCRIAPGEVDPAFTELIPIAYARRHRLIGLKPENGCARIAASEVRDLGVVDHVAALLRIPTVVELAPAVVIEEAINQAYTDRDSNFSAVLDKVEDAGSVWDELDSLKNADLLDTASRAPVIKLVNMILFEAAKRRASDVHVQPSATGVQVRHRIDGVLYDFLELPSHLLDELASRVKVIGQMDIAEKRLAQDGRTTVTIGDKLIDLRISIIPTSHGERVVLRLLDKSARLYALSELGMSDADRARFAQLLQRTHGIILVTGPTGSGKSTTLYAALQHLDCTEKSILTLEDPIEYQLPGISQTQVSLKKGMTFATGLRAVLHQDPDVIMVGEIRDEETARMAVQSSMTGHLVFSTLHTNDAAGAVTRLLDLGIEPYLVASSLLAVLAQRLVRIACPQCRDQALLTNEECRILKLAAELEGSSVSRARGCHSCSMTGYFGRQGIFELLVVDEYVREMVMARAKASAIKQQAIKGGMTSLRRDGISRLLKGETTVEEVSRTTHQEEDVE